jgi:MSHA biogenesis protein MshJ
MKQYWQRIALKIDALSLRERAVIFGAAALVLLTLVNTALLEPQSAKQKQLSQRIKQEQAQIAGLQAEILQKVTSHAIDPDAATRIRLQALKEQSAQMQGTMRNVQTGLISPDKMSDLLESMLKQNGKLRLVSLKTLPVAGLNESVPTESKPAGEKTAAATASPAKDKQESQPAAGSLYKHGVEVMVQGEYLDMMNYMAALEAMPWQLFWGRAKLSVDEYPKATLTLTLFTLSLDKAWLNI